MSDHDTRLLERFAKNGDETAFKELVARNFDLVYSVALRQLNGDTHFAEDAAQCVFTDLARKARIVRRYKVLSGWLYEAARRAATKIVRTEQRRRLREQEAVMVNESESSPEWEQVRPVLDLAMDKLSASDRNALLLHYFEERGFRAIGAALGISDDAAQKRVARALPKLRNILERRGVSMTAATLAAVLSASAVTAAPVGMAFSVSTASLANAASAPAGLGALWLELLHVAEIKTALKLVALLLVIAISAYLLRSAGQTRFGRYKPIDLSHQYNGDLAKNWTPSEAGNNLQSLPRGRQSFGGVPFDIHGVVQLQGGIWRSKGFQLPEHVQNIPVGDTARRIHLLHADGSCAPPAGTRVAGLVINYADGQKAELPIKHGVHCFDWWAWDDVVPLDPNTRIAWTGVNNAVMNYRIGVRLFQTAFLNPEPTRKIQSIDYVSNMTCASPFMVALTVEH